MEFRLQPSDSITSTYMWKSLQTYFSLEVTVKANIYVINRVKVFSNVRNASLLWSSALKLAKKFNSTSFNLKQEVFIRRDEEKTRRGLIYIGGRIRHLFGSKSLTCESNLHTFSGGSVIFDQCHIVWRAVAIKLQHMWMCLSHSWGDEGMTLLNSCQVLKSLACIDFCGGKQLNWGSIEQVSSPASPSGWSRYVLRHVWSKIPNIVELG